MLCLPSYFQILSSAFCSLDTSSIRIIQRRCCRPIFVNFSIRISVETRTILVFLSLSTAYYPIRLRKFPSKSTLKHRADWSSGNAVDIFERCPFESRPGHRLFCLMFSWLSSFSPIQCWFSSSAKSLPPPSVIWFFINLFYIPTPYRLSTEGAVKSPTKIRTPFSSPFSNNTNVQYCKLATLSGAE